MLLLWLLLWLPYVLIETYWNVNLHFASGILWTAFVLIETYWNVNINAYNLIWNEWCINRNILECKYA